MMADLKNYAIGTLTIGLLISLGFAILPNDNYFCRTTETGKYCDRLSSSGLRCYPIAGTTKGYKDCSSGWEKIYIPEIYKITAPESTRYSCSYGEECKQI